MRIEVTGKAVIHGDAQSLEKLALIASSQQLRSKDSVVDDLPNKFDDFEFTGGHIELFLDHGNWMVRTTFETELVVSQNLIEKLAANVHGQWSDGLGSGCFTDYEDEFGIQIDLSAVDGTSVEVFASPVSSPRKRSPNLRNLVLAGNLAGLRKAIAAGAELDKKYKHGCTALHTAVTFAKTEIAIELIRCGADMNRMDVLGDSPLMCAAYSNDLADEDAAVIARELLARGVDPNAKKDGKTPIWAAQRRGKTKLAAVIREFGGVE